MTGAGILVEALGRGLPGDRIVTDPDVLAAMWHDDAEWAPAGQAAAGVRARSEAEVQHVVRTCAELGAAIVPRGAGTGLSGGANAVSGCVILDLSPMNRVLEIDPDNLLAVVQPGAINNDVKAAVAEHGLWYPPDPASAPWSTIGGNVATRACPVDHVGVFRLDRSVDEKRLRRHDVSDAEWARLEPLLPAHPRQGHRWNDHRLVIDGIFFRTRTGCPWRDLPERFGNWKTVYNRHRRWSGDGTWEMILDRLRAGCDEPAGRAWTAAVDATVVRAHQHAAGARREPPADIGPARLAPAALSAPARLGG